MALTFYYLSGSPYAWRVWLALESKGIVFERRSLSMSAGDLKSPAYLAVNPRGRVPAIVDDDYTLWESAAIVEYLDQRHPDPPLFPRSPTGAATVRRMVQEADQYFVPPMEALVRQVLFTAEPHRDAAVIAAARHELAEELLRWEAVVRDGPFLAGDLSAADHALYPMLALVDRMEGRHPAIGLRTELGPAVRAWKGRVEALPYFPGTWPPHWR